MPVCLSLPEHAQLPESDLIAIAADEADCYGLDPAHIKVGQWSEFKPVSPYAPPDLPDWLTQ